MYLIKNKKTGKFHFYTWTFDDKMMLDHLTEVNPDDYEVMEVGEIHRKVNLKDYLELGYPFPLIPKGLTAIYNVALINLNKETEIKSAYKIENGQVWCVAKNARGQEITEVFDITRLLIYNVELTSHYLSRLGIVDNYYLQIK